MHDERGFWHKRNEPELIREVERWNQSIAALAGQMRDALGDKLQAEILKYPNFEHIEAKGNN